MRTCVRCGRSISPRLNGIKKDTDGVVKVSCICRFCEESGYFYCNKKNKPCHYSISQDCESTGCNNSCRYNKFLYSLIH